MLKNRFILETVAEGLGDMLEREKFLYLLENKPVMYALNGILRDDENEERVLNIFKNIIYDSIS